MSPRVRMAIAALIATGALIGMIIVVARWRTADDRAARFALAPKHVAVAPFSGFDEARVALGSRCLRLLVATTPAQRSAGLRGVRSLDPYAGMLFVFANDTDSRFTMAGTPLPLEIAFFDSAGNPVDSTRMTPCLNGNDSTCPAYASRRRYRYALERAAGATGAGSLGGCSS